MSTSPHIANPRAASQYLVFFCSYLQFSECVHTFSMDIELRNDRIPRNPFDRQFLDMLNHLMILHYHQEMTDRLDLKCIANEYIMKNESATFPL